MSGAEASLLQSRRQMCADLSPMLEAGSTKGLVAAVAAVVQAMVRRSPEPMQPGAVVQFVQASRCARTRAH